MDTVVISLAAVKRTIVRCPLYNNQLYVSYTRIYNMHHAGAVVERRENHYGLRVKV